MKEIRKQYKPEEKTSEKPIAISKMELAIGVKELIKIGMFLTMLIMAIVFLILFLPIGLLLLLPTYAMYDNWYKKK